MFILMIKINYPMIFTIIFITIITIIFFLISKKSKPKKIIFVGKRFTGKTKTINYLEKSKCKTVPTLEPYEINFKKYIIREELHHENYMFNKHYKYIFFLKDEFDTFKPNNYDITFVLFKPSNCKISNVFYLNNDPSLVEKLL